MNKRGTGVIFCLIAAILYASRYLAAAIFMSGVVSWDADLFKAGLEYVGPSLLICSVISLVIGCAYLIWAEIEAAKKKEEE